MPIARQVLRRAVRSLEARHLLATHRQKVAAPLQAFCPGASASRRDTRIVGADDLAHDPQREVGAHDARQDRRRGTLRRRDQM